MGKIQQLADHRIQQLYYKNRIGLILAPGWNNQSIIDKYFELEQKISHQDFGIVGPYSGEESFLLGQWNGSSVVISCRQSGYSIQTEQYRKWLGSLFALMGNERCLLITDLGQLVKKGWCKHFQLAVPDDFLTFTMSIIDSKDGFVCVEDDLPDKNSPYQKNVKIAAKYASLTISFNVCAYQKDMFTPSNELKRMCRKLPAKTVTTTENIAS